ncbi:MAG TPA: histidine kinase, partial [Cyanothece sp. UBA12306]|nr:histidine kinase [Cyanothece sp. UBA12306]
MIQIMYINKIKKIDFYYYLYTLFPVIVILVLTGGLIKLEQERFKKNQRLHALDELTTVRAKLESSLNEKIFLMRGLVAYISVKNPNITQEEFENLTRTIVKNNTAIPSAALFKNSICTHLYPLKGQEAALGFEPLKVPEEREAFERAIKTKKTVLSGPVDLYPQGGLVFITRTPVFLTPPNSIPESGDYWGMISIGIKMNTLLEEAGIINQQQQPKYIYSIRGQDGLACIIHE